MVEQLKLFGELVQIVVERSSFALHKISSVADLDVRVGTEVQVGIKPTRDGYVAAVTTTVIGDNKEKSDEVFRADCKIIGFYVLDSKDVTDEEVESNAVVRGRLQIYPLTREYLVAMLAKNGILLKSFPFEPELTKQPKPVTTKKKKKARRKASG